jgi:hypothetical protein
MTKTITAALLLVAFPEIAHAHHEEAVELARSTVVLWPFVAALVASLVSSLRGGK